MTPAEERTADAALRAWADHGNLVEDENGAPFPHEYQPVTLLDYWLGAEQMSEVYRERALMFDRIVDRLKYEGVPDVDQLVKECRDDLEDVRQLEAKREYTSMGYRIIDQNPGHTTVQMFVGVRHGSRGNAGQLVFRTSEFETLRDAYGWDEVAS